MSKVVPFGERASISERRAEKYKRRALVISTVSEPRSGVGDQPGVEVFRNPRSKGIVIASPVWAREWRNAMLVSSSGSTSRRG